MEHSALNHPHKVTFKVFPIVAMLALVIWNFGQQAHIPVYDVWIGFGLLISIVADTLSEFGSRHKRLSYILFLIVFVFYSKSLWMQPAGNIHWWLPALLVATSTIILLLLLPKLDAVIIPVIVMGTLLTLMACAAGELWLSTNLLSAQFTFVASLCFMGSGLLLALSKFNKLPANGKFFIHGGYYIAQGLMVASIVY